MLNEKSIVEAALFASGAPLNILEIARVLNTSQERAREVIVKLKEEYEQRNSALEILELEGKYVLQLKGEYSELVSQLAPREISTPVLRTLSIIAYFQPITQSKVVQIRGNKAYEHIKELWEKGLISSEKHGRTKLLKTTQGFAEYFGLIKNDIESIKSKIEQIASERQVAIKDWLK
ncbi:MAG: SMC-Scp complex subunit ScpB [Halobacteria archaeon]